MAPSWSIYAVYTSHIVFFRLNIGNGRYYLGVHTYSFQKHVFVQIFVVIVEKYLCVVYRREADSGNAHLWSGKIFGLVFIFYKKHKNFICKIT